MKEFLKLLKNANYEEARNYIYKNYINFSPDMLANIILALLAENEKTGNKEILLNIYKTLKEIY